MKKLISAFLGLSLLFGSLTLVSAQTSAPTAPVSKVQKVKNHKKQNCKKGSKKSCNKGAKNGVTPTAK